MEMIKKIKQQKGITLVEVLAVLVILGILATVAIPAIGAVIDNSKKNSVIATAEQLVAAVKIKEAAGEEIPAAGITGATLISEGYLDAPLRDPDKKPWTTATVTITAATAAAGTTAATPKRYNVTLESDDWEITGGPVDVSTLEKDDINEK